MARPIQIEVSVDVQGAPDLQSLTVNLDKVGDSISRTDQVSQGVFERIGHRITDMAGSIVQSGVSMLIDRVGSSIELASDKAEAANKAQILFGDSFDLVAAASENAAQTVGLSSGKYLGLAGDLGNLTTNLGYTADEASKMSVDMLQLAADMGSFNNASTEDVVAAMGAAFRGETEPIRQFGVFLDDARVKAKAMELGLYDGVGAIDANAKAQATYALILEQTSAAQGDFSRTADGLANSSKIAAASQEEAWTRFGAALLPAKMALNDLVTGGVNLLVGALTVLSENVPTVLAVLVPLGVMIAASVVPPFLAWAAATLAATWPLLAIGAAVGTVVFVLDQLGILDVIIGLFGELANVVGGLVRPVIDAIAGTFGQVANVAGQVANVLQGPLDVGLSVVRVGFDVLRGLIDGVIGVVRIVTDVFGQVAAILRGPVEFAISLITKIFDTLWRGIQVGAGWIKTAIDGVGQIFSWLQTTAQNVIGQITTAWNNFWGGIQRIGQQIMDFLSGLFDPLADTVNKAVGIAVDIWNGFVRFWNGFELVIPAVMVGDFQITPRLVFGLPDLPMLAHGGIVTRPMLAGIGEAGPEAIVPLDRMPLGNTYIVNVEAGVGDPVAIGAEVIDAIRAFERANGPAF